jgi:hypothetical protein
MGKQNAPDFKRIKRKVGKKAPVKQNQTKTVSWSRNTRFLHRRSPPHNDTVAL